MKKMEKIENCLFKFWKNRKEKQKSEENGAVVERNLFTIF